MDEKTQRNTYTFQISPVINDFITTYELCSVHICVCYGIMMRSHHNNNSKTAKSVNVQLWFGLRLLKLYLRPCDINT